MSTTNVVLHANLLCRQIWKSNQKASLCFKQDGVLVTSCQSNSTPGIYTVVTLHAGNKYVLEIYGHAIQADGTQAFVWIYDPCTKQRLIKNYVMLPYTTDACCKIEVDFTPCRSGKFYIGILFTDPCCGQRFILNKMNLLMLNHCACPAVKPSSCVKLCLPKRKLVFPSDDCCDTETDCGATTTATTNCDLQQNLQDILSTFSQSSSSPPVGSSPPGARVLPTVANVPSSSTTTSTGGGTIQQNLQQILSSFSTTTSSQTPSPSLSLQPQQVRAQPPPPHGSSTACSSCQGQPQNTSPNFNLNNMHESLKNILKSMPTRGT